MEPLVAIIILAGIATAGLSSEERPDDAQIAVDEVRVISGGNKIQYGRSVRYWVEEEKYFISDLSEQVNTTFSSTESPDEEIVIDPADGWRADGYAEDLTLSRSREPSKGVPVKWLDPDDPAVIRMTRPKMKDPGCEGQTQTVFTADLETSRPDKSKMYVGEVVIGCG